VYYAIANASAWTLGLQERRAPRAVAVAGVLGCIVIAFSLPATSVIAGAAVLLVGAACWATIVTIVRRNRR
jgi:APA family basic amino acid/polyamine antiporter